MQTSKESPKDPATGVGLSLLFPGLGHLYAGNVGSFVVFLAFEIWLASTGRVIALIVVHLFQAVAAGGAVKQWNQKRGFTTDVVVPPPPPARGSRGRTAPAALVPSAAPPPATQPSTAQAPTHQLTGPLVLDADAFLMELQDAWREHRTGGVGSRQFADRKWRAIRAVRVESREDGEALLGAARELATAGVLTSEEIGQLESRLGLA